MEAENVLFLEITELVLVHCDIVTNNYQQHSRVLLTFVPNKSFDQLLDMSSKNFIFSKIFDSVFLYLKLPFTDKNSELTEFPDKISITLVINENVKYKK